VNKVWRLQKRPEGRLDDDNFSFSTESEAKLEDREVRIRTVYLSVDPANRVWTSQDVEYMPPVKIGEVMRGGTLGVIEESRHPDFAVGDIVQGIWGWQSRAVIAEGRGIAKITPVAGVPLDSYMSVLGVTGMTAYFGLLDITDPQQTDTLVVSAAAGAVGSIVGQIGKIIGCRVVGIAGSEEKCRWLTEELGYDAAINYRREDVSTALRKSCPDGIDIYFENVGGAITDAVFAQLNLQARISLCGLISQYNNRGAIAGPGQYAQLLMKRVRLQGFIVLDYWSRFPEGQARMIEWLRAGKIRNRTQMVEGIENALQALNMLFDGDNIGKLLVRVSPEPRVADA